MSAVEQPGVETGWRAAGEAADAAGPWADWLLEPGSLTQRLRERCHPQVRVKVLEQERVSLEPDMAAVLDSEVGSPALRREVVLVAADVPRIYARTLVPQRTLDTHPWLAELGENPLGDALFTAKDRERSEIEVAHLDRGDALVRRAAQVIGYDLDTIWARRSLYRLAGAPLSVCECFLPGVLEAGP